MSTTALFFVALALSMDAAAVTVCNAMASAHTPWRRLIMMPILFGFFQGFMPFLGYFAGDALTAFVGNVGGIIVAIVLSLIGLNMLREGLHPDAECPTRPLSMRLLLVQAITTSIDALAVGVSFGAIGIPQSSAILIGFVTFAVVLAAVFVGRSFGQHLGNKAQLFGGILLILVAIRSLF